MKAFLLVFDSSAISRNDMHRKLDAIPESDLPQAVANCSANAAIVYNQVLRCYGLGTWRVILKMQPKAGNTDPVDLRCTLQKGTNILSETWTYQWSPP